MSADHDFVRLSHLTKRFGAVTAVGDAHFSIGRGEFFSLLGPSGCGKTTLLRIIAGLEDPDSGDVFIDGAPMTALPPNKRPTNMVFQSYAIFPHLNVAENIAYGLRKAGLSRRELAARVDDALSLIKLEGFGKRRAHELSGGQRQRVALARALVNRPKVLLLDEPLGALDKQLREAMQIELRQLQKTLGITFIFVTHDQEEALSMSDRVAVMAGGTVLQIGAPRALYDMPACRAVAAFIGTMNFFAGRTLGQAGDSILVDGGALGRLPLPAANVPEALRAPGVAVTLAIRPEKIVLGGDETFALKGRIAANTFRGAQREWRIAIEGLATPIVVTGAAGDAFGETVSVGIEADAMIVLPA